MTDQSSTRLLVASQVLVLGCAVWLGAGLLLAQSLDVQVAQNAERVVALAGRVTQAEGDVRELRSRMDYALIGIVGNLLATAMHGWVQFKRK